MAGHDIVQQVLHVAWVALARYIRGRISLPSLPAWGLQLTALVDDFAQFMQVHGASVRRSGPHAAHHC